MPFQYVDYVKAHKKIAPFTSRIIARTLVGQMEDWNVIDNLVVDFSAIKNGPQSREEKDILWSSVRALRSRLVQF